MVRPAQTDLHGAEVDARAVQGRVSPRQQARGGGFLDSCGETIVVGEDVVEVRLFPVAEDQPQIAAAIPVAGFRAVLQDMQLFAIDLPNFVPCSLS